MELTPEERQKIYLEEKARMEVRRELEGSATTRAAQVVVVVTKPSNGTSAVLSLFIPGGGQMYKGRVGQGIAWMIFTVLGYLFFIVPGLILHLICIFSAYSMAPVES
jgi:TM2 domain-containing membrane protein YozV